MLVDIQRHLLLAQQAQLYGAVFAPGPVGVAFELAAFRLGREHDDHPDVLVPDDRPKVLNQALGLSWDGVWGKWERGGKGGDGGGTVRRAFTSNVAGSGPWLAMYRLLLLLALTWLALT